MTTALGNITIAEILRGCTPGRIQSVGFMQVIPLTSDLVDNRFSAPGDAKVSTSNYGTLIFENNTDQDILIPAQAAYVVKEAAQDHALPHAGFVKARASKRFDTAMCIQQGQGGYIPAGKHKMIVLPFPLREAAHKIRNKQHEYSRLWPAIAELNAKGIGTNMARGHLEYFLNHYKSQLDRFVAEFEPVPRQVGAIIMIGGKVVGIERTPNYEYWKQVWTTLIRECYGSLALIEAKNHKGEPPVPNTRVPIKAGAKTVKELKKALKDARDEEYERVKSLVNAISAVDLERTRDEKNGNVSIESIGNDTSNRNRFVGQLIRDDEKVVYASLVATNTWRKNEDWFTSTPFKM